MKCQDLMTLDLRWVRDTATVLEAAMSMQRTRSAFCRSVTPRVL